jgi:hypothetical protein
MKLSDAINGWFGRTVSASAFSCKWPGLAALALLFAGPVLAEAPSLGSSQPSQNQIHDEARKHNQLGIDLARRSNHRAATWESLWRC